jgi:hypothetical protein
VDQDASQIERDIAKERQHLGRNLHELERLAKDLADWRTYYRRNPLWFLGSAIGAGLILGAMAGRGEATAYEPDPHEVGHPRTYGLRGRAGRRADETWEGVSDALMDVATEKIVQFVGGLVPGFNEHYARRSGDYPLRASNLRDVSTR